jgi:hypothetical protein
MMIERRQPKLRRRGEKNGKTNWWKYLSWFVELVMLIALLYVTFGMGRYYESEEQQKKYVVDQKALYKEYKSYRVGSHK